MLAEMKIKQKKNTAIYNLINIIYNRYKIKKIKNKRIRII